MLYIFIFIIRSSIWRNCTTLEQKQNEKNRKSSNITQQIRPFNFSILMGRSNGSKLPLTLFYTSQAFQQDHDHSIRNPDKRDTYSGNWNKNKEATTRAATMNQFRSIAF